mmetsp:Transcript_27109/g.86125  ORF Transcript_27109/g.86125 Transcript_27109/m.86125 type:complete len:291 (+) Transcript_27109:819-1691(+)
MRPARLQACQWRTPVHLSMSPVDLHARHLCTWGQSRPRSMRLPAGQRRHARVRFPTSARLVAKHRQMPTPHSPNLVRLRANHMWRPARWLLKQLNLSSVHPPMLGRRYRQPARLTARLAKTSPCPFPQPGRLIVKRLRVLASPRPKRARPGARLAQTQAPAFPRPARMFCMAPRTPARPSWQLPVAQVPPPSPVDGRQSLRRPGAARSCSPGSAGVQPWRCSALAHQLVAKCNQQSPLLSATSPTAMPSTAAWPRGSCTGKTSPGSLAPASTTPIPWAPAGGSGSWEAPV